MGPPGLVYTMWLFDLVPYYIGDPVVDLVFNWYLHVAYDHERSGLHGTVF